MFLGFFILYKYRRNNVRMIYMLYFVILYAWQTNDFHRLCKTKFYVKNVHYHLIYDIIYSLNKLFLRMILSGTI